MDKMEIKQSQSTKFQYFAAISANLVMAAFGSGIGWLSMALPLLQSDQTPLDSGPLTVDDVSWIGAIISCGALIANIATGYLVTVIGSKNSILLLGIPQLCGWLLMIYGKQAYDLYAARFFVGVVGGGVQICISLYVAEIADNDIRGTLATIYQFSRNVGILIAYVLGSYFDYITSSYFFICITIIFYLTFSFLPSTPQYLLQKNKIEIAEKSYRFYKGYKDKDDAKLYASYFENLKNVAKGVKEDSSITLKEMWDARKSFIQALVFPLLNQLSGAYIFLTYGSNVIEKSGTHLPQEIASISLAVVQLFGTFLTSQLVDTKGRRFLLILSMSGLTLGHAAMITYLILHKSGVDTSLFHWTPVICMGFIILIASIGIVPLTLICLVECFPVRVRPFGVTFGNVAINVFSFFITKSFPILSESIGLEGCLFIFAVCCALGIIYMISCVNETMGKELNVLKRVSHA